MAFIKDLQIGSWKRDPMTDLPVAMQLNETILDGVSVEDWAQRAGWLSQLQNDDSPSSVAACALCERNARRVPSLLTDMAGGDHVQGVTSMVNLGRCRMGGVDISPPVGRGAPQDSRGNRFAPPWPDALHRRMRAGCLDVVVGIRR
jgi:hypothetical protein